MDTNELNSGLTLRLLRESLGLTQKQLADKIHVSNRTVSAWENGTRKIRHSVMIKILKEYDASIYDLLDNCDDFSDRFRFYICKACGNTIIAHKDTSVTCCSMKLIPESMTEFGEFPEYEAECFGDLIKFTVKHEMSLCHYIKFIAYVSRGGCAYSVLNHKSTPTLCAVNYGEGELFVYCTRRGLCHTHYAGGVNYSDGA